MNLTLTGHSYKYAVEQILLALFPDERPCYGGDGPTRARVSLSLGDMYATAVTVIEIRGQRSEGRARALRSRLSDAPERERLLQRLVKLSFYRAALPMVPGKPIWGALTGIRPAKLLSGMLESGISPAAASARLAREYYVDPSRARLCLYSALSARDVKSSLSARDVALYVGIPFCPTRCSYCSFVSLDVARSMRLIEPYLDALAGEIEALARYVRALKLHIIAVYIGGGTPTTLTSGQLSLLLDALGRAFDLSGILEYTVEAGRPDTITAEKLLAMTARGVTRLSVNPQSMSDTVLEAIGRRHTARDVLTAYALARGCGFDNINMDLISGLPGDTPDGFARSLNAILRLGPENITVHTLAKKRGSQVTRDAVELPEGAAVGAMLDIAANRLYAGGYSPYYLYRQKFTSGGFENVGWSRPGYTGLYNILMMEELCSVLSLGGGGVTKLVHPASGRIERIFNPKYPEEYIARGGNIAGRKAEILEFYEDTSCHTSLTKSTKE